MFILERAILKMQMRGEVHCKFLGDEWRKILRGSLRDVVKFEVGQKRANKMLRGLQQRIYKKRLRALGLFRVVKRRQRGTLIVAYSYLKNSHKNIRTIFFSW